MRKHLEHVSRLMLAHRSAQLTSGSDTAGPSDSLAPSEV
jgi:hypothetical protein